MDVLANDLVLCTAKPFAPFFAAGMLLVPLCCWAGEVGLDGIGLELMSGGSGCTWTSIAIVWISLGPMGERQRGSIGLEEHNSHTSRSHHPIRYQLGSERFDEQYVPLYFQFPMLPNQFLLDQAHASNPILGIGKRFI